MNADLRAELASNVMDTDALGVEVIYTFEDGSTKGINAREYRSFEAYSHDDGDIKTIDRAYGVSQIDIPSPARGETVTDENGDVWELGRPLEVRGLIGIYPATKQ